MWGRRPRLTSTRKRPALVDGRRAQWPWRLGYLGVVIGFALDVVRSDFVGLPWQAVSAAGLVVANVVVSFS